MQHGMLSAKCASFLLLLLLLLSSIMSSGNLAFRPFSPAQGTAHLLTLLHICTLESSTVKGDPVTFDFPERCPLAHSRGHSRQVSQLEGSPCQCFQYPARRGRYWTGLRASVERVFHSGQLAAYAPLMNEAAEKLNTRLAAKAGTAAEEGAAAGTSAAAAPVAAAPAGAAHRDGAAAGEGGDADAAAVAGKAAAQGEAAEAAASATAEAALTSINLSAALATMTLEVIGTSAFG